MHSYPFLQQRFLSALERSGSVDPQSGWKSLPIEFETPKGNPVFMPLYAKTHSWGEYVFDWAWADAYHRYDLRYYPKLITAIPFTPATGSRIRTDQPLTGNIVTTAVEKALSIANEGNFSSWHLLFADPTTMPFLLEQKGLLHRTSVQYHWSNQNYSDFDDFLAQLKSRKRKMIRRERETVKQAGLEIKLLNGEQIDSDLWSFFYQLYKNTYIKRSGNTGYLTEEFFSILGTTMSDQVAMAVAFKQDEPIAAALYFYDDETLYGRYWGCIREYEHLHFELCYYQGIELAIAKGLQCFDAGAQGEHKIMRGFKPRLTHSMHWIKHPQMSAAIADFIKREHQHNLAHIKQAENLLPYKNQNKESVDTARR